MVGHSVEAVQPLVTAAAVSLHDLLQLVQNQLLELVKLGASLELVQDHAADLCARLVHVLLGGVQVTHQASVEFLSGDTKKGPI